jgi:hypothetical protein
MELLREVVGKYGKSNRDCRDDDAGNQSILKGGNGLAVCPQLKPQFCILKHGPLLHTVMNGVICAIRLISTQLQTKPGSGSTRAFLGQTLKLAGKEIVADDWRRPLRSK